MVSMFALRSPISRSLFMHAALFLAALASFSLSPKPVLEQPITVTIEEVDAKNTSANDEPTQQIVQKSDGDLAEQAKKNSYLSEKTRVVNEERSAKNSGEMGSPKVAPAEPTQKKPQVNLGDLGLKVAVEPKKVFERDQKWATPMLGEGIPGGQYIQGMKEGETSALNTKEFVFYSYFDRVRRQLDQAWQPILRGQIQRLYQTGRHLASNADYVTKTLVTLSQKGEIVKVQVLEESGTFDLDQAAIEALNEAGPYPNPPKGLIGGEGTVHIRWDFILKT
jgi:TonB family protein